MHDHSTIQFAFSISRWAFACVWAVYLHEHAGSTLQIYRHVPKYKIGLKLYTTRLRMWEYIHECTYVIVRWSTYGICVTNISRGAVVSDIVQLQNIYIFTVCLLSMHISLLLLLLVPAAIVEQPECDLTCLCRLMRTGQPPTRMMLKLKYWCTPWPSQQRLIYVL